jgi:hypothetical protein
MVGTPYKVCSIERKVHATLTAVIPGDKNITGPLVGAAPARPRRGSDVAGPKGSFGDIDSLINRLASANAASGDNPRQQFPAAAATISTIPQRRPVAPGASQGARHSRLGSGAATWAKFDAVAEGQDDGGRQPQHGRTLSEIPAEERTAEVIQEYDAMVRQYHDYVQGTKGNSKQRR